MIVDGRRSGARVDGDRLIVLDTGDAVEAWAAGQSAKESGEIHAAEATFAAVSPTPAHIVCMGLNYRSHIAELGRQTPEYPTLFAKFASTLTGPYDAIGLPVISELVQGEVELAAIIGRRLYQASPEDARTAIAGYTIANDLSLRDWQHRTTEALQGKVFDRSTPLGPFLITPDEVDDAQHLAMSFSVDGVAWQSGSTSDMLFKPADIVSYCSQFMTLERRDVVLTGTPGQVSPTSTISPGSLLRTSIEGLGEALNPTTRAPAPLPQG